VPLRSRFRSSDGLQRFIIHASASTNRQPLLQEVGIRRSGERLPILSVKDHTAVGDKLVQKIEFTDIPCQHYLASFKGLEKNQRVVQ